MSWALPSRFPTSVNMLPFWCSGLSLLLYVLLVLQTCHVGCRNNFVLVLTDDQDTLSSTPMRKTIELVAKKGAAFQNSFASTPICCPSRATLLTGLYQHNTNVWNNSIEGNCNSHHWQVKHEPHTFAQAFHEAGYRTFYGGKYLNQYGSHKAGGLKHVPKGWDWWAGLKGNSRYYNYTLSLNGTAQHFTTSYLTDHIYDLAVEFLRSQTADGPPFLMVLAPPAPHAPYTPSPKYSNCYPNASVPRTPNFNPSLQKDKHWMVRLPPNPLPQNVIQKIDEFWRRRWCTLQSVDDMVAGIVKAVKHLDLLKSTFILVTSDNGYHLGHYGLPWDKRQLYDTDIRVPFYVRGPGVKRKVISDAIVTVDIAPTLLEMARLPIPGNLDGRSVFSALISKRKRHQNNYRAFLVEYAGEGGKSISSDCPWHGDPDLANCDSESACKCQDARNNTYACARFIGPKQNSIFCQFNDREKFVEAYNMLEDPHQMRNIAHQMSKKERKKNIAVLKRLQFCAGLSCNLF